MASPTRRDVLAGASALALGASVAGCAGGPRRRPNVLFLISDQHRADLAGFAGDRHAHTPNLDRLARRGITLDRLYCHNPLCVPSRQSLITGQRSHEHGWFGNVAGFPADLPTLARHWRRHGYRTAMIGKAHMATHDFDVVQEKSALYRAWKQTHPGAGHPGDHLVESPPPELAHHTMWVLAANPRLDPPAANEFQMEPAVVAEARRFLTDHDRASPFFLWASFVQPHPPRFPAPEWLERFRGVDVRHWGPTTAEDLAALPGFARDMRLSTGADRLTPEELHDLARAYHASVSWTDHWIGELLRAVEELYPDEETLVVYTSDHGEMLGDHGLIGKFTLYEPACRVPAIIRFPDGARAGERVERVAQHLDLLASLFALAGLPQPAGLSGAPLPELVGEQAGDGPPEEALCEMYFRRESHVTVPRAALATSLRIGRWKFVGNAPDEEALYDLDGDPEERHNLIADRGHAAHADDLRARVRELVPEEVYVVRRLQGGR